MQHHPHDGGDEVDPNAFDAKLVTLIPELRVFFRRRSSQEADEMLAQTLLAALLAGPTFRGEAGVRTFVYRIAHRVLRRSSRQRVRYPTSEEESAYENGGEDRAETLTPELAIELGRLRAAIAQLDAPMREVIRLFYWEDLSQQQVAERLGSSVGTVASRLRLARNRLRVALDPTLQQTFPEEAWHDTPRP